MAPYFNTLTGSSNLDPDQQDFYVRRFGRRYLAVQQQPQVASRAERRRRKFKPKASR